MTRFAAVFVGIFAAVSAVHGDDWPMFGRDRSHNAATSEKGAPIDWENATPAGKESPAKAARNIKWSAQLGMRNLGGPVIANGLIWVGTNNWNPRDPRDFRTLTNGRREPTDMSVLMCFRESDGQFLWQYASPRLGDIFQDGPWHCMGSTPLIEGDRLWINTNRCETVCFDIGPLNRADGPPKEAWKVDLRKTFGVYPHADIMAEGLTPSVVADAKHVFVVTGNGVDQSSRIPAPDAPSLVCLDKKTGATIWTDASPGTGIPYTQRSSPLLIDVRGQLQVVVGQGDGWLRAFDVATGQLIWKCDLNPKGARYALGVSGRKNYVVATPVWFDGRIYIAPGQSPEHYAGDNELFCIDPSGRGDVSAELDDGHGHGTPNPKSKVVWKYGGPAGNKAERQWLFSRTLANCVGQDGLIYAGDIEGYCYCFAAKTGQLAWQHDLKSSLWCGALWADGKVYFATEDGEVWIFAHGPEKKLLAKIEMNEQIRATPVYVNGTLYVMTEKWLHAIRSAP